MPYVGWVLLAIMILVFVHELGHFLFAKLFGMRVDKFSVGFPPKIIGKKVGDTEYVVGLTPLGGYVKIAGMVDESLDTEYESSEPQDWEFRSKPVWQRIIVITAGVAFNFLLAVLVFTGLKIKHGESFIPAENVRSVFIADSTVLHDMGLRTGDRIVAVNGKELDRFEDLLNLDALTADRLAISVEREGSVLTFEAPEDLMTRLNRSGGDLGFSFVPSVIGHVFESSPAAVAGLTRGDRVTSVAGVPVLFWAEMTQAIKAIPEGASVPITWTRGHYGDGPPPPGTGQTFESTVTPAQVEYEGRKYYGIGVSEPDPEIIEAELGVVERHLGTMEALEGGVVDTWLNAKLVVTALGRVVTGRDDFRETMGGPIAIARITKQAADLGASAFWNIVAVLSITLGIVNILPIPALDGGHLVFLLYEGIMRREPSLRFRMITQQIGMITLLVFMALLIFNDILRL